MAIGDREPSLSFESNLHLKKTCEGLTVLSGGEEWPSVTAHRRSKRVCTSPVGSEKGR